MWVSKGNVQESFTKLTIVLVYDIVCDCGLKCVDDHLHDSAACTEAWALNTYCTDVACD